MMAADLITVVLLSYGPGPHYEKTLQSVLQQDYPRLQLIVSDDASGRLDRDWVAAYLAAHRPPNLESVLIRENAVNLGIPGHDNEAARLAQGEYIKFIADGDAFCSPTALRTLYEFAKAQPQPVVTAPVLVCNEALTQVFYQFPSARRIRVLNHRPLGRLYSTLAFSNIISAVGMLFHRRFFTGGGFDTRYRYLEDWPAWLRLVREGRRIPCASTPVEYYSLSGICGLQPTAFDAPRLREDLLLCYESEIFPHFKRIAPMARLCCRYRYRLLKGFDSRWEKLCFSLCYAPIAFFYSIKALMKKLMIKRGAP